MHICETFSRLQSSANSHCGQPADPPQTAHLSSVTWAHDWCFIPRPFAHNAISFTSIFFLHTMHVPGNFIGMALQLILLQPSPFGLFRFGTRQDPLPVFYFLYTTKYMASKKLQRCCVKRASSLQRLMQVPLLLCRPI